MFNRFKEWLYCKYLPSYAKERVWADNKRLYAEIEEVKAQRELDIERAYSRGMAYALRHMRISIKNEVKQ